MSSSGPAVSILVPVYNAGRYLAEFCRSVQAQSFRDFEVIFANDGSTDDSVAVLSPYLGDRRFRLVGWRDNRGLNRAWAALCSQARGDYWCSPGADDVLHPAYLEHRLAILRASPQAALVHGPAECIDEEGHEIKGRLTFLPMPSRLERPRALAALLQHNYINQPSALVRTGVTRQVLSHFTGSWAYSPDWFFWILHAATGGDFLWDAECRHRYRVHATSLTLDPGKDGVRRAEIRLVPLCALAAAKQYSKMAAEFWTQWRKPFYRRWLACALKLRFRGSLRNEWLRLGAEAFYGPGRQVSLVQELCRHGAGMVKTRVQEKLALRTQTFRVSGLAQINDPIFR